MYLQATSYVSRRRLDDEGFDLEAVDEEGLPLVYNEARIAAFWSKRPGELASRWTRFAAISGEHVIMMIIISISSSSSSDMGDFFLGVLHQGDG
jgi:hypothetical protein